MQRFLFALVCFSILTLPSYAYKVKTSAPVNSATTGFQTMRPLISDEPENTDTERYPKITELEYHIFNKSYEKENIYSRLTRLENKIFRKSFVGLPLASRVDNLFANVDEGLFYGIQNKDLVKLEMKVLGTIYSNDDTESRITRLEKEMLGAMQSGNLKERYETVKLASKHYNSYPELAQSQRVYPSPNYGYYPQSYTRGTGINGFMQNIVGRLFGDVPYGALTGFTPPVYDVYNQYASPYYGYNPNSGIREYNMGNTGGYYRNRNYGGNSTVKILN